jgi:hypothetical protein
MVILKTRLLFCFVVFGLLPAFKNADAKICACPIAGSPNNTAKVIATKARFSNVSSLVAKVTAKSPYSQPNKGNLSKRAFVGLDSITRLLRLKLVLDTYNNDDILIAFNSAASTKYNANEDSEYFPGNAPEGLSSFSSDGVQLSQNYLPLPKQTQLIIRLDAEAEYSGPFTLERTELDSLPPIYGIWLVDNYKKNSLDLRVNSSYNFKIDKTDTASFGKNRFYVVVRQNPASGVHLLDFTATKASTGAQINWKTENEQNYTRFTVERSIDDGATFDALTAFASGIQGTYKYLDINPPAGVDQYRLKIADLNGTVSYSNVVTLVYGNLSNAAVSNISIYPNPAGSTINLAIKSTSGLAAAQALSSSPGVNQTGGAQSYSIKIINITGAVVKTATSSQPTWQDNVDTLKPGTYFIQVVNNSNNSTVGKCAFIKL